MPRPLSVVVPTRDAWPAIEPVVAALAPQCVATGAELVVVDGTGTGAAVDHGQAAIPPELVRVAAAPGADVYELRAIGLTTATGEIVAVTEDHCVPAPDYVAAILASHARHAEHAIAGVVVNGSPTRLIDRVNFMVVHARNLPLHGEDPDPTWIPTPSNISYKRVAVPSDAPQRGWLETVHNVALRQADQVVFDDRIVVRHVQSTGRLGTFLNHFHAGKSMGGLARGNIGNRTAQLRWGFRSTLRMPAALVRPVWTRLRGSPSHRREVLLSLPLAAALSVADSVGFCCGVLAGTGRSAHLLR